METSWGNSNYRLIGSWLAGRFIRTFGVNYPSPGALLVGFTKPRRLLAGNMVSRQIHKNLFGELPSPGALLEGHK